MQKKLIALAVAGLVAAPAFAQSNVTVYGVVDAFYGYGKMGPNKLNAIQGGGLAGSRIGFRGTEDLGNGMSAVFTLEYAIANDVQHGIGNTGTALNARQSFVGLQGGFGFVGLGHQYAPGFAASFRNDALLSAAPFSPQSILSAQSGATITPNNAARWSNAVAYRSPNFSGLTASAIYSLGEANQTTDRRNNDRVGLGANYANGPIGVDVVYHRVDRGAGNTDQKEWFIGGSYDFGMVKLAASYQQDKIVGKNKIWQVGAIAPVGVGKVHVAYADLDHRTVNSDADAWSIAYTHPLSKRTTLYTGFTQVDNQAAQNISPLASRTRPAADPALDPIRVVGQKSNTFGVGVNHSF